MNKRFLILLLIIFVIGIVVYKYSKIKESFTFNTTCFDDRMITNSSDEYLPIDSDKKKIIGQNFTKLYHYNLENDLNKKLYNTFVSDDFNEDLQNIVASFLAVRVAYNLYINTVPEKIKKAAHYSIIKTYKIDLYDTSFNYFECILNSKDNVTLLKFTLQNDKDNNNNPKKILKIENNIPYTTPNESPIIISDTDLNLKVITLNTKTILKYGVLVNQISIKIGNTEYCQDLPTGIDNHFMENLTNITFYMSSGATFRLTSSLESGIYASLIYPKIESTRTSEFKYVSCGSNAPCKNTDRSGIAMVRAIAPEGYYPLGDYSLGSGNNERLSLPSSALVVKKGDYVIPVETMKQAWNGYRGDAPYAVFYINQDVKKETNIDGVKNPEATFYALGDYVRIENSVNNTNTMVGTDKLDPIVLIHQDCLEEISNDATWLTNDSGSSYKKKLKRYRFTDLTIWTYHYNFSDYIGFPGERLASFQQSYANIYNTSKRNWRIKKDCLEVRPFPALVQNEIDTVNQKINEQTPVYLEKIKTNKSKNDGITNPYENVYNELSLTRKNNTQNAINSTVSFYQTYNKYNQEMRNNQQDRNKLSNFIISTTSQLSDIRNKEKELVNNELATIKSKINSDDWINPTIINTKSSVLLTNNNTNNLTAKLINNLDEYEKQKSMKRNYNIDPQVVK